MLNPEEKDQQDLMFVDKSFEIRKGLADTGYELGITVSNRNRCLRMWAPDHFEWKLWVNRLEKVKAQSAWGPESNLRFDSFSPERPGNQVQYFIDGEDYFGALYKAL